MLTRKIRFDLFKQSGKWYAGGDAFVDPSQSYFEDDLLLEHIDQTQKEIGHGSISAGHWTVVVSDIDDGPFIKRIIHRSSDT
jgi:hypothetical protein